MLLLVLLSTLEQNYSMSTPNLINVPRDTFEVAQKVWGTLPVHAAGFTDVCLNLPDAALTSNEQRTQRSALDSSNLLIPAASSTGIGLAVGASREGVDPDAGVILRYNVDFSMEVPYTVGGIAGDFLSVRLVIARRNVSLIGADPYVKTYNWAALPGAVITWSPSFAVGVSTDLYRCSGTANGSIATYGSGVFAGEPLCVGLSLMNTKGGYVFAVRNLVLTMSLGYWVTEELTLNPNI